MIKPHIKYRGTLSNTERRSIQQLVKKGNTKGCRIQYAQILLALDEIPANEHWSDMKQRLLKFLLRKGKNYESDRYWTGKYYRRLTGLKFENEFEQMTLEGYYG
jgi:hypothetical protein